MNAWSSAWARATLVPAGRRVTPVWLGTATIAGVVFGPNGMRPHDVTVAARDELGIGVAVAVAWLLLVAPVGRALVRSPGTDYLRALPGPRAARWLIASAGAVVAQLPWTILWTAGEGAAAGALATVAAAAVTVAVGLAPGPAPRARAPRWRRAWTAAAGVHARGIARTAGASVVRGAGLALLAGTAAGAIIRVNALAGDAAITYACAIGAALIAIGLAGAIHAVADGERRLDWLARATGLGAARGGAIALVLGGIGAALGAIAGSTAAILGDAGPATTAGVAAAVTAVGLGLGLAGARLATWARIGDEVDGARVVAGAVALGLGAIAAVGALGALGIAVALAGGAAAAAANVDAIVRAARTEQ